MPPISEETRARLSLASKGRGKGQKLSPDHIEKLRSAKLGKPGAPRTPEWKRNISMALIEMNRNKRTGIG